VAAERNRFQTAYVLASQFIAVGGNIYIYPALANSFFR
jgi:hypothetical protein